jgi:hypothetical protein
MKMRIIIIGLSLVHAVASVTVHASEADANASTTLWYERPATDWMKGSPAHRQWTLGRHGLWRC